jgi:PAS domain S-box-containing protein
VHPDDLAQDDRDLATLRANRDLRSELRTLAKDGRVVWVEVAAHPVWDDRRNRLVGIYGAVKDVTRRKQAEAETQATTATLNAFVDSVPGFGAYVDADERYRFVNRYHENWFKDSRRQFIGRRLEEVHRPETYAVMRPYSRRALAGEAVRYEHEMTGRDGKYYCFDVQYVPRRASDGAVLGYFSLVFDVTERVLRDRQLLRTQRLESVGPASRAASPTTSTTSSRPSCWAPTSCSTPCRIPPAATCST